MKTKRFVAVLMAAAMATSMAATTAMSTSAADFDTPIQEEIIEAAAISTTAKTLVWNPSTDGTCTITSYGLYKVSNPSSTSMANGAITNATLTKSGSTYTLVLNTQAISGKYLGITYSATIKTVAAVFNDGSTVSASKSGNTYTITFPTSKSLPWVGDSASTYNGFQNSLQLNFTTTMEDSAIGSILPDAMKNPQAFFMFTVPSSCNN